MNFWVLLTILLFVGSCSLNPDNDYKKLADGVFIQLHGFESGKVEIHPGDYITADIKFLTKDDSVFFEGKRKFRIEDPEKGGLVNLAFIDLRKGDTASVIVPVHDFFNRTIKREVPAFIKNDEAFKIGIRISDVQTRQEFIKEKKLFMNWVAEFRNSETGQIEKFIDEEGIPLEYEQNGIYFMQLVKGNGRMPVKGERITIHYEGRFLNGKFIESTKKRDQPLDFIFGSEMVVIEGIERAVERMTEGEKALVIIPSDLAFGSSGAANGLIPPYTSLIYEVELVKVE